MALNIPDGFGSAAIEVTGPDGTQPYITTIGVDRRGSIYSLVQQANLVYQCYSAAYSGLMANAYTISRVILTVSEDGVDGSVESTDPPTPGTGSGNYLPIAAAAISRKATATIGRKGRGRMFIPGVLREDHVGSDGVIDNDLRDDLQEAYTVFLSLLLDGSSVGPDPDGILLPVVLHTDPLLDPSPIIGGAVASKIGWIRGRLR